VRVLLLIGARKTQLRLMMWSFRRSQIGYNHLLRRCRDHRLRKLDPSAVGQEGDRPTRQGERTADAWVNSPA